MNNCTIDETGTTYSFAGQDFTVTSFVTESEGHRINLNFSEKEMRQFLESLGYKERTAKIYPDNGIAYVDSFWVKHNVTFDGRSCTGPVDDLLKTSNFGQIYGLVPTFEYEFKKHILESPKKLSDNSSKYYERLNKINHLVYGALKKLDRQDLIDAHEMEYFELTKDK